MSSCAPSSPMSVGVIGGGTFAQGLAAAAARNGHRVTLVSRRAPSLEQVDVGEFEVLSRCDLVLVAVPSTYGELAADRACDHLNGQHLVVHVSRGLVGDSLTPVSEVFRKRTAARRVGALAGPLVAEALLAGEPSGGIVASAFPEVIDAVQQAIGSNGVRLYGTQDLSGVEFASAFVGLLSLAGGYAKRVGIGPGTLAVMLSRGMSESTRLGVAMGGHEDTFAGLAGHGDLLAAVAGDGRPEWRLGEAIGGGMSPAAAAASVGAHIEGVQIARRLVKMAARHSVEVPVASTIADVLEGLLEPSEAVERLMTRPIGS